MAIIKQYYWYCAHEFEKANAFIQCTAKSRRYFDTADEAAKAGANHQHEEIMISWKRA